jgi:membrane protein YdbS with pleckstrin-like domain
MVLIAAVAGYLLGSIPNWLGRKSMLVSLLSWSVLGVALLLIVVMVGRRFVRWARMHAALTDRRIAISYGRRQQGWDIPLLTIVDVACDSGLLARRFDTGSLVIRTNFAYLPAVIPDVPHVGRVREAVLAARAQAWNDYQRSWSTPSPTPDVWAAS